MKTAPPSPRRMSERGRPQPSAPPWWLQAVLAIFLLAEIFSADRFFLQLTPGPHTLMATAEHPSGWVSESASSTFTVTGTAQGMTQTFDGKQHWRVNGPDLAGGLGSQNGLGGLEAVISSEGTQGVLGDLFGNVLASVTSDHTVKWNPAKVASYGPAPNAPPQWLETGASLVGASSWRTRRADPTGLINLGARHYDPTRGLFVSADPLGHGSSWSLYDFASGDPVNLFDADGRVASGWNAGANGTLAAGGPNSLAFNWAMMVSSSASGGANGAQGGASILINTATFGRSDHFGITQSFSYQG